MYSHLHHVSTDRRIDRRKISNVHENNNFYIFLYIFFSLLINSRTWAMAKRTRFILVVFRTTHAARISECDFGRKNSIQKQQQNFDWNALDAMHSNWIWKLNFTRPAFRALDFQIKCAINHFHHSPAKNQFNLMLWEHQLIDQCNGMRTRLPAWLRLAVRSVWCAQRDRLNPDDVISRINKK